MEAIVRYAEDADVNTLLSFLEKAGVGTEGVKEGIEYFLIMENAKSEVTATIGIEPWGKVGLLRSLIVTPNVMEKDIFVLFEQILKLAQQKELETIYLATNRMASIQLFQMLGFVEENKSNLPQDFSQSEHVQQIISVDNSVFLKLIL